MKSNFTITVPRVIAICAAATAQLVFVLGAVRADEKLAEPVYRVANETTAAQPVTTTQTPGAAVAAAPAVNAATKSPLDFTQKQGEHPLTPVLRALKVSQEELDRNIHDYSCTFAKRERVNGVLGDYQIIMLKVMHQPFSVYMSFLKPYAGREVVYVDRQNDGKMIVLDAGFTRVLGKFNLDPNGQRAMDGQKHPITDVGMRNLTMKLTKMWEPETKFAECDVTVVAGKKVEGRTATMVQIVHPTARQNFKFNAARIFFDDELKIPIHFDAYSWPAKAGGDPELEESYTYAKNLKVNNNFTGRDFDAYNNPEIFKK